ADAGIPVRQVSDYTGFPEMLEGRVKTLDPKIHGGLLGRRDVPAHVAAMREHGIEPIDLVAVNLYPFRETVARPDVTLDEAIEQIDIGGPAMLRSAAKNHPDVTVIVDPRDYPPVLAQLRAGAVAAATSTRPSRWPRSSAGARMPRLRSSSTTRPAASGSAATRSRPGSAPTRPTPSRPSAGSSSRPRPGRSRSRARSTRSSPRC